MVIVMLIVMALIAFVGCEKDTFSESQPAAKTEFNIERAVVGLVYGHITGQKGEDIQMQYQALVSSHSSDQIEHLREVAKENYRTKSNGESDLVQMRSGGSILSPGDTNTSFGASVDRSANT